MRNAIWIICLCFLLAGCHRNLSESISLEVKSDLTTVEKKIDDIRYKLPKECLATIENDLNRISDDVKQIQLKVNNLKEVFKSEKEVLEQKSRKKTFIILFLVSLLAFVFYNKIKVK